MYIWYTFRRLCILNILLALYLYTEGTLVSHKICKNMTIEKSTFVISLISLGKAAPAWQYIILIFMHDILVFQLLCCL